MVNIRPYHETDFPVVEKMWRAHHSNDFRKGYIPAVAFVVFSEGEVIGFFGMAPMTHDFCYLCFPLVSPTAEKEIRDEAVDLIIASAKLWATGAGIPIVWISIRGEKFLNRLEEHGFTKGETGNVHMFAKVGEIQ